MTYKDTVINGFINYPSIFPNRLYVDNHLFATNGNGYEWVNGQLVDVYNNEIDFEYKYNMYSERYDNYNPNINYIFSNKLKGLSADKKNEYVISVLNTPYKETHPKMRWHVYPICEYAKIMNIPDDVQPDWLEAIENFVDFCLTNTDCLFIPDYDDINDYTQSNAAKRIDDFKLVKTRINELKNKTYDSKGTY